MFLGSDARALAPLTRRIAYLRDGDWAIVTRGGAEFRDMEGRIVNREVKQTAFSGASIGKDGYRHYMEKELHEHPSVIGETLRKLLDPATRRVALPDMPFDFARV